MLHRLSRGISQTRRIINSTKNIDDEDEIIKTKENYDNSNNKIFKNDVLNTNKTTRTRIHYKKKGINSIIQHHL